MAALRVHSQPFKGATMSTEVVLNHHLESFGAGDLDGLDVSSAMAMTSRCIRVLGHHGISLP